MANNYKKRRKRKGWKAMKWKILFMLSLATLGICIYNYGITPLTILGFLRLFVRAL